MLPTIWPSPSVIVRFSSITFRISGRKSGNETKRFIILVDTLYDHGVRLYRLRGRHARRTAARAKKGTEGFEFDRTVSRLFEMRSAEYLAVHHAKTRR